MLIVDHYTVSNALFSSRSMECQMAMGKDKDGKPLFIFTQEAYNTGASVTNSIERLTESVCHEFGHDRHDCTFIEHYYSGSYRSGEGDETFDLVRLGDYGHPNWKALTYQEFIDLVGLENALKLEKRWQSKSLS